MSLLNEIDLGIVHLNHKFQKDTFGMMKGIFYGMNNLVKIKMEILDIKGPWADENCEFFTCLSSLKQLKYFELDMFQLYFCYLMKNLCRNLKQVDTFKITVSLLHTLDEVKFAMEALKQLLQLKSLKFEFSFLSGCKFNEKTEQILGMFEGFFTDYKQLENLDINFLCSEPRISLNSFNYKQDKLKQELQTLNNFKKLVYFSAIAQWIASPSYDQKVQ